MVKIVLTLGEANELCELTAAGHAEAGFFGSDPVCAAVSFLVRTVALYLDGACSVKAENRGSFSLSVHSGSVSALRNDLRFLARLVKVGVESLTAEYPNNVILEIKQKKDKITF